MRIYLLTFVLSDCDVSTDVFTQREAYDAALLQVAQSYWDNCDDATEARPARAAIAKATGGAV